MVTSSTQHSDTTVLDLLAEARIRARTSSRPVLVSVTERIAQVDPLQALDDAVRSHSWGDVLAEQAADRMYWSRPIDGIALAGIGTVKAFASGGPERFADLDRDWTALLDGALISDASDGEPGGGPVLMGGCAFEPEGPTAPHWREFPSALFTLPRLQLAAIRDVCWLTTTILVAPDGTPDVDLALLGRLRDGVLNIEHAAHRTAPPTARDGTLAFSDALPVEEWRALVRESVAAIRAGYLEKVVLARMEHAVAAQDVDVVAVLRYLRAVYADCYVFGCWRGDAAFVGATPERLAWLGAGEVRASSLAGSIRRGATPQEDIALGAALLDSAKDRAEHALVRRALVDGLAALCDDVAAPAEPSLVTLPNVHHLYTPVRGRLRAGGSLLDLVARLHPTPAVGGVPREAALEFIRAHERLDRGWYAAPLGWIGRDGGELAVALRSALIRRDEAWLFAGCGIVADSDPDREYAESLLKLRPMKLALAAALAGDSADTANVTAAAGATAGAGAR
jgi:isochorismate synthase